MNKAPLAVLPTASLEPAFDGRWPDRVEYMSPHQIELLRRPPSGLVEAGPADGRDDDTDDDFGLTRGLAIGILIGAHMWGAIGLIVWLLLA